VTKKFCTRPVQAVYPSSAYSFKPPSALSGDAFLRIGEPDRSCLGSHIHPAVAGKSLMLYAVAWAAVTGRRAISAG